ncbi:MAG: hypothetical protein MJ177_04185 [Clostridia bacterium]|nr:hypothetical protein [Clostridia bacterium]
MSEQIVLQKQDLTYLNWAKVRNSSGTAGTFLKAYSELAGKKTYYKLSDYDSLKGIIGHEGVNEIIVDRLLSLLNIEHLSYRLTYADIILNGRVCTAYVCSSEDFKQKGEDKTALDTYYELEHTDGESALDFCIRQGWEKYIYEMLVTDFIVLNRDRHGANIEVLRNKKKKTIRLAPLFDHGLSLLFSVKENLSQLEKTDVMEDKRIQCYVGSGSAYENLKLIPKEKLPDFRIPTEKELDTVFEDVDKIIPAALCMKIREMISGRLKYYEDFRNKK